MLIGYARTSTVDQVAGLEAQETALAAFRDQIVPVIQQPLDQIARRAQRCTPVLGLKEVRLSRHHRLL
jgi:DNA invertase Pin-like site-specific DNA recombinase